MVLPALVNIGEGAADSKGDQVADDVGEGEEPVQIGEVLVVATVGEGEVVALSTAPRVIIVFHCGVVNEDEEARTDSQAQVEVPLLSVYLFQVFRGRLRSVIVHRHRHTPKYEDYVWHEGDDELAEASPGVAMVQVEELCEANGVPLGKASQGEEEQLKSPQIVVPDAIVLNVVTAGEVEFTVVAVHLELGTRGVVMLSNFDPIGQQLGAELTKCVL